jgi:hypothetical protein
MTEACEKQKAWLQFQVPRLLVYEIYPDPNAMQCVQRTRWSPTVAGVYRSVNHLKTTINLNGI